MIIYMKKSYKKRSRKRSTKKRARRRTRRAGDYSKLAKDVLKKEFDANKYKASLGDQGEAAYLQRKADARLLHLATDGRGIFGPDGIPVTPMKPKVLHRRALQAQKRLSNRIPKLKPLGPVAKYKPLNARERLAEQKIRGTKRKREGGRRKRKTRRRGGGRKRIGTIIHQDGVKYIVDGDIFKRKDAEKNPIDNDGLELKLYDYKRWLELENDEKKKYKLDMKYELGGALLNDKFIYNAEKDIQRTGGKRKTKKKRRRR